MIIDLHTHTYPRSSCSVLSPADLVKRAKELGLDAICITEHNEVWPKEEVDVLAQKHDLLVLRGMEASTSAGHVLVYGLDRYIGGIWDVWRLRQAVDATGGVMILAHPMRDRYRTISRPQMPLLFDAIEVLNGGETDEHNAGALDLSLELGLKGVAGSDSHAVQEVGSCATVFEGEIRTERDLVDALKANGYHPKRLR